MSLPKPLPGLVVRYSYLWADDAAAGYDEGDKDRPAAIVMAVEQSGGTETRDFFNSSAIRRAASTSPRSRRQSTSPTRSKPFLSPPPGPVCPQLSIS